MTPSEHAPRTLLDKLWDAHRVVRRRDGLDLLYIDRHLLHEVSSPVAFANLAARGRRPWRQRAALAVPDHNVPTHRRERGLDGVRDPISRAQIERLAANSEAAGIEHVPLDSPDQGIVHVIGPETGFTLPGMTVVCGDSHTSTHGALAALAFGIGTRDIEHVLATQTLALRRPRAVAVEWTGALPAGVTAKDMALDLMQRMGASGGNGCALEYRGETVRALDMAGRMTLCNMSIECGARVGMVAVDDTTLDYVRGRPRAPRGAELEQAEDDWRTLVSDDAAEFDRRLAIDADQLAPQVSWGTSPSMTVPIHAAVPDPEQAPDPGRKRDWLRALQYMDLRPGTPLEGLPIDRVFIGSCTNARLEDLRAAAAVIRGHRRSDRVRSALVVPGSMKVKADAEAEGLHRVFEEAGFEWRASGCSMCLGLNEDRLQPGERCAATSNRNFEGRQGPGGRTHLVSPAMAAAAAVAGKLVDVRRWPDVGGTWS